MVNIWLMMVNNIFGWWYTYLPLWKMMLREFVSWDDFPFPTEWNVVKSMFQLLVFPEHLWFWVSYDRMIGFQTTNQLKKTVNNLNTRWFHIWVSIFWGKKSDQVPAQPYVELDTLQ